jgi:hypothetical protein
VSCLIAPVTTGASSSALAGGLGSCLACFSKMTTSPVPPSSSFPTADARDIVGCKDAPWELVQPRHGMRSKAVVSPTLKTHPPPHVWLHGRCHRCHEVGHCAAMCCEPLKCNNCLQFGHKAKYCTGKTVPRPPPVHDLCRPWQRSLPAGSRSLLLPCFLLLVLIQHVCESARGGRCVLDGVTR